MVLGCVTWLGLVEAGWLCPAVVEPAILDLKIHDIFYNYVVL